MVRNYKKKCEQQKWSSESMQAAVNAVINGEMGYFKAATQYAVPQTTLERYVKKQRDNPQVQLSKRLGKFKCVFSVDQENELSQYLINMEQRLFGLTSQEVRYLAFQLANRNGQDHPFNKDEELAGIDWFFAFKKRHPELSLRKPEATSAARAMGFNKVAVDMFFNLLEEVVEKHGLTAEKIFNVDETGITVNPKSHSRVLSLKGRRQVGVLTSGERGETVTAEICFSAAGAYMSPMLIFPRKRLQQEFETGLSPGAWAEVHQSGWITKELFLGWFKKFVVFSKASKESPVLLLLDGHTTHTKNLDLIDYARDNGVILLSFPPHCSHHLQPLDVSFMKPLSKYYEDEVRKWLRTHPGRVVTLFQIASLFGAAYIQAATMLTAINGFKKTGVWPVDRNVFTADNFLPADTTDILPASEQNSENTEHPENNNVEPSTSNVAPMASNAPLSPLPGPSQERKVSSFSTCSPEQVLAIPKINQINKRKSRKRGKTAILTSSPYKADLKACLEKKIVKTKKGAKKLCESSSLTPAKKTKVGVNTSKSNPGPPSSDSEDNNDAQCLYCNDFYSKSNEGWIICSNCLNWAHNSCAGVDSEDDEAVHICVRCE